MSVSCKLFLCIPKRRQVTNRNRDKFLLLLFEHNTFFKKFGECQSGDNLSCTYINLGWKASFVLLLLQWQKTIWTKTGVCSAYVDPTDLRTIGTYMTIDFVHMKWEYSATLNSIFSETCQIISNEEKKFGMQTPIVYFKIVTSVSWLRKFIDIFLLLFFVVFVLYSSCNYCST